MAEPLTTTSYFDQQESPPRSEETPTIDHPLQHADNQVPSVDDVPPVGQAPPVVEAQPIDEAPPVDRVSPGDAVTKQWDKESSPAVTHDFHGADGAESIVSDEIVDNDDTSIEDYMSRLLDRVNNGIEASESGIAETQPPPTARTPPQTPTPEPGEAATSMTVELRQPKRVPEDRSGLIKMREVANDTAQSALQTHHCRAVVAQMYGKLSFILVACILSSVLALLAPSILSIQYGMAIVAMVLTSVGAWRFAKMTQRLSELVESP